MIKAIKLHGADNLKLGLPVMAGHMGHMMVGVADSVMVGRVGVVPLAAASFSNSVFVIFMVFCIGLSFAITPLTAEADGRNDTHRIADVFKHGLLINLFAGLVLSLLLILNSKYLGLLGQDHSVVKLAQPYFILLALSLIPFMIFQSLKQTVEGLGFTKAPMILAVAANILNILLNYIFIFGMPGIEPMGLFGAGLATLISRIIQAILLSLYLIFNQKFNTYHTVLNIGKWSFVLAKKLLTVGIPIGMQTIFEVSTFSIAAIMIGWLGPRQLAAHQIAINLASITYMLALGLSTATTIRVANQIGRKNFTKMYQVVIANYGLVLIMMSVFAILFIVGRSALPPLYVADIQVHNLAAPLLIIAGLFQISDGLQVIGLGALRGMSDVNIPTMITLVAYWVVGLGVGYVLGFHFEYGAVGIWIGLLGSLMVAALLLFLRFRSLGLQYIRNTMKPEG